MIMFFYTLIGHAKKPHKLDVQFQADISEPPNNKLLARDFAIVIIEWTSLFNLLAETRCYAGDLFENARLRAWT